MILKKFEEVFGTVPLDYNAELTSTIAIPLIEMYTRAVPVLTDVLGLGTRSASAMVMTTPTPASLGAVAAELASEAAQIHSSVAL